MLKDKRLALVALVLTGLAVQFWAGSRVPALNEKALMGGDTELGALGFDVVLQVKTNDPLPVRALYETVNWVKTNQRGMTFGVLFASTLMLLLSLFKKRSFQNRYANSMLGMVIGAPLGVCVNCAAPIAKGLYSGGARIETTLAAMISSPTLNIIVLTMLISLFPLYMVAIKLALTVTFILLCIPILTRILARNVELQPEEGVACPINLEAHQTEEGNESWFAATIWVVKNWLSSFWHVFKTTVPLMFLAGFLGALLVTLLPWESMAELIPSGSRWLVLANMILLAIIGVFLPVPIAFDVILVAILLAAGLPVGYAMVLLFTLGIYSIYSFFIVWREISKPMAVGIWVVLIGIGVGAGIIGDQYYKYDSEQKRQTYFAMFNDESATQGPSVLSFETGESAVAVESESTNSEETSIEAATVEFESGDLEMQSVPFRDKVGDSSEMFTKYYGKDFGLNEPYSYTVMDYILSWGRFRGIAAGDIQNDGFADLLITSKNGVALYRNTGDGNFVKQHLAAPELNSLHIVNGALVDMNNDGWLDIVVASYKNGNFLAYNRNGRFTDADVVRLPNMDEAFLTGAMGFGDIDGDGDLDGVFGNFGYGSIGITKDQSNFEGMASSRDALLINTNGEFSAVPFSSISGDTMSTLLYDFNDDGNLDLISANDFGPPDLFLLGDGSGAFRPLTNEDGIIPFSGSSTMSIVAADVDNNLVPEIFVAQISGRAGRVQLELLEVEPRVCAELEGTEYLEPCVRLMDIQADFLQARKTQSMDVCLNTDDEFQDDCVALMLLLSATRWNNDASLCDLYSAPWAPLSQACKDIMGPRRRFDESEVRLAIPQQGGGNALLFRTADGRYEDRADVHGLKVGGWSWNSRFADVNNDEWLDIFIVNGDFASSTREANFFYLGSGNGNFRDATTELGFASHLETASYTYVDVENDGDLDIIALPEFGPVFVYRNNARDSHSISVALRDYRGNSFGIGSKIIVRYGTDGSRHQLREIQMSGGFVSFDAPVAHFGLAEFDQVAALEVRWSTGETDKIDGPFSADKRYTITRRANGVVAVSEPSETYRLGQGSALLTE